MVKELHHSKISVAKKQVFDYKQIAMAYHESSHIIIYLHNFIKVEKASIMTPKLEEGATFYYIYKDNYKDVVDERLRRLLIMFELEGYYGGPAGERLYYKDICGSDAFPMHLQDGWHYDIANAAKILRKNNLAKPGKDTFILKKQIQNDASQILIEYWSDVKLIAHSLYKKRRLTFDEIKYILCRRSVNAVYWRDKFAKIKFIHNDKNPPSEEEVKNIIVESAIHNF